MSAPKPDKGNRFAVLAKVDCDDEDDGQERSRQLTNSILTGMVARSWLNPNTACAAFTKIFHDLDLDRDGTLSLEEFMPLTKAWENVNDTDVHKLFWAIRSGIHPSLWEQEFAGFEIPVEVGRNGGIPESAFLAFCRHFYQEKQPHLDFDLDVLSDEDKSGIALFFS